MNGEGSRKEQRKEEIETENHRLRLEIKERRKEGRNFGTKELGRNKNREVENEGGRKPDILSTIIDLILDIHIFAEHVHRSLSIPIQSIKEESILR